MNKADPLPKLRGDLSMARAKVNRLETELERARHDVEECERRLKDAENE